MWGGGGGGGGATFLVRFIEGSVLQHPLAAEDLHTKTRLRGGDNLLAAFQAGFLAASALNPKPPKTDN